ncbi:hypothetical protein [Rarobacter incanus]|uniref:Uncharacterized protein n=1 Tax=Rarobacter incanus TaxID=153494 RepID=A0A542SQV9_9MICO|nr:hypothetical protein [Rarobacter incanus]TQK77003.1 hypothetical protein FB389_1711 [Rarobacter incanus]
MSDESDCDDTIVRPQLPAREPEATASHEEDTVVQGASAAGGLPTPGASPPQIPEPARDSYALRSPPTELAPATRDFAIASTRTRVGVPAPPRARGRVVGPRFGGIMLYASVIVIGIAAGAYLLNGWWHG